MADAAEPADPGTRRRSPRLIGVAIVLMAIAAAVGLVVVGRRTGAPAPGLASAGNGLIAYSHNGDIYVGDPISGATRAIVTGPESDINPKFAPDGSRIAFVRGDADIALASLMVVRSDGSDERVVVPRGFNGRTEAWTDGWRLGSVGPFAWTPDGNRIVVEIDSPPNVNPHHDGELTLFEASGVGEPRVLVPPLGAAVGAVYFNPSAAVAPMFRPPAGDQILGSGDHSLEVFDASLTSGSPVGDDSLWRDPTSWVDQPTWSPDGARILFLLSDHVHVMNADGGGLRSFGPGDSPQWSPDGSAIAYEDWDMVNFPEEMRIAVIDLASGTKRVLESSVSPRKQGATVDTISSNIWHTWAYEGWSWSPDGRSLLLLRDHRTRPVVVDVSTDTATELPWTTDSFPSWQGAEMELTP